ncbi:hypothetical protein C0995_000300, partial [Termitomyces sp. Mi166
AIVGYALDSQGRHVAIKAILFGSEEHRILKHLQNQGVPTSMDDFQNVIPIFDILPCEGHWLAIMPRFVPSLLFALSQIIMRTFNIKMGLVSSGTRLLEYEGSIPLHPLSTKG